MIFKRSKNRATAPDAPADGATPEAAGGPEDDVAPAPPPQGPFDAELAPDTAGHIDLGALLVEPVEGMALRLEVEDRTQRVIAAALELDGSRVQLQVFAAPKSESLWPGISGQIERSIKEQKGTVQRVPGRFGEELIAKVPSQGPDGQPGFMVARFIGIDGPRWFLRAVVGGPATLDRSAAERIEERIARLVVVRGDKPMPPAELLPLAMPEGATARPDRPADGPAPERPEAPRPPERGPEITEIG